MGRVETAWPVQPSIQRSPQRLRFEPPEIVQGERRQAEQDQAIAAWLRTQIAPRIERSIEAIVGKPIRKAPIGLRGKYYGEYSPPRFAKRFQVNTWGFPFYLWRTVNGVRVRSALPDPKDAPKRVGNVIVIPHVPQGKSAGDRPVMPAGWTIDWQALPDRHSRRPLAWQLGLARLVRGLWTYPIPAYLCSRLILNKQGEVITLDVGFTLKRDGISLRRVGIFCTCERGLLRPVSTYIPYRRPRSGRILPIIEDPNAEMSDDDLLIMVDGAAPKEAKAASGPGEPDDAELTQATEEELDDLDEYMLVLNEPEEEIPAALARDMATRYVWQVARDIPYSRTEDSDRAGLWRAVSVRTFFTAPQAHKRGRPPAGEDRSGLIVDEFDEYDLWLTDRRLRQMGYPDAERLAMLASKYKISTARAKRVRDSWRDKMLEVLRCIE